MRIWSKLLAVLALAIVGLLLADPPAKALPSFAAQTGQPCTACHIGGYGPQLTPLGRAFKIGGYTQRGGEGWQSYVPFSAMVLTSFNNTNAGVPTDQITPHYAANNNFSLDQVSGFLAGGIGEHTGGFVQFTYSNILECVATSTTPICAHTRRPSISAATSCASAPR